MGLDMYLKGKLWIRDLKLKQDLTKQFKELESFSSDAVQEITIEAIYWRKANAIHKWFVDNVQEGTDDCGSYYVSRTQLEALRETCQRVLDFKHLANGQLPTQEGFFFGNTEYDEGYYDDLRYTVECINQALTLPEQWDFEYHSSW